MQTPNAEAVHAVEHIYHLWDEALGAKDVEAAAALYAPDTELESPLVRHLLRSDLGVVEGRDKLRDFIRLVFERTPSPCRGGHPRTRTAPRALPSPSLAPCLDTR